MGVVELEEFAFSLLNNLFDDYGLNIDYYSQMCRKIQEENTADGMQDIISELKALLLDCMKAKARM